MQNRLNYSDTLSKMYEERFLSDFNLRVEDRWFPVHKAILGVRSPVFRAMFTNEKKQNEDNCSFITDVDKDTLQRILLFIYSDKVEEDIDWERVCTLYKAADKYALKTLKQRCSVILRTRLCAGNVLDILLLADMFNDQELKSSAFELIYLNENKIIGSERWNRFKEENKQLASDTLHSLYLHFKKMTI